MASSMDLVYSLSVEIGSSRGFSRTTASTAKDTKQWATQSTLAHISITRLKARENYTVRTEITTMDSL